MADNPYAAPRTRVEDAPTSLARRRLPPRGPRRAGRQRLALDRGCVGVHGRAALDVHRRVPAALRDRDRVAASIPLIGPLARHACSRRCCSAGSCSAARRCAAASRSRSGICSPAFSGTPASSSRSVRSRSRSTLSRAIIMILIVGASLAAVIGGAEPTPEEISGMLRAVAAGRARDRGFEHSRDDGDVVRGAVDRAERRDVGRR